MTDWNTRYASEVTASSKEYKKIINDAVSRGWTHDTLNNGHNRLTWPHVTDKSVKNVVVFPSVGKDNRGIKNTTADIARIEKQWPAPTENTQVDD